MDQCGNGDGLGTGVMQQPNQGVITPLARQTFDSRRRAEITYQYSAGDMVGASGTYYISRFGAPPGGEHVCPTPEAKKPTASTPTASRP